jgi:hypothetical protein
MNPLLNLGSVVTMPTRTRTSPAKNGLRQGLGQGRAGRARGERAGSSKDRRRVRLTSLLLAITFIAAGAAAQADGPCGDVPAQRPAIAQIRQAHGAALPDLSGGWLPYRTTYRAPASFSGVSFAGVNGELQGKIAFFVEADGVVISNRAGAFRRLHTIANPLFVESTQSDPSGIVAYWENETLVV